MLEQEVVGVVATNSRQFLEAIFECERQGAVAVPLRSADDRERRDAAGVTRVIEPGKTAGFARFELAPGPAERIAQIAFTSGTTGTPQGILLTEGNVVGTARRLNDVMRVDGSIAEYVGIPVYYSFGLGRVRAVSSAGGEVYLPPTGFDPAEIGSMLANGEINALSAVPTLLRLLLENRELVAAHGKRLKWLEIGSQLLFRNEKEALKALFPNAVIVQHYGLTEASRTTFLEIHATEGAPLDSVGRAQSPIEVKLASDGRIMIRGPHVAAKKLSGGGLLPLTDEAGWLLTNDLGRVEDGYVFFEGRADDLVNCGGVKIAPESFEGRLAAALGQTSGIAVGRIPDRLRGDGLLVAFTPETGLTDDQVRRAAVGAAEEFGLKAAGAITVRRVAAIPRTETGKTRRSALSDTPELGSGAAPGGAGAGGAGAGGAAAAAPKAAAAPAATAASAPAATPAELESKLLAIWRETLGIEDLKVTDSFYDVGGDSLTAVAVALRMEKAGVDRLVARRIFEGKTIEELVRELAPAPAPAALPASHADATPAPAPTPIADPAPGAPKRTLAALNEASNFLRGIVLLAMVSSHWMPVYIQHGGPTVQRVARFLHPFFSMGSPTLAVVFGLGVSLFYSRQYARNRNAFASNIRTGALLLSGGMVIYAALELWALEARHMTVGPLEVALALYGPLVYYALATLSLPLWIRHVKDDSATIVKFSYASLLLYLAYTILEKRLPSDSSQPFIAYGLRLLVGKWGVVQMGSLSAAGVALGTLISRRTSEGQGLAQFVHPGLFTIVLGFLLSLVAGEQQLWFKFPKNSDLWSITSYVGLLLFLIGAYGRFWESAQRLTLVRRAFELVCSLGVLLFPLFVVQSLVYHVSLIVVAKTGLTHTQAISLCILFVVAAVAYPIRRVHRLYYA